MNKLFAALLAVVPATARASTLELSSSQALRLFQDAGPSARLLLASQGDPQLRSRLYALAFQTGEAEKKLAETQTGLHNIALFVDYLSKTQDGPRELRAHLANFEEELGKLAGPLEGLAAPAEGLAAETKPESRAADSADALKAEALRLRALCEGTAGAADLLARNVAAAKDKLGEDAVAASRRVARDAAALSRLSDALVERAEEIVRKSR